MIGKSLKIFALICAPMLAVNVAQASITVNNTPNGNPISPLTTGGDTTTYGEVFTVPAGPNTQLDSFGFYVEGGAGQLFAGVAQWTGTGAGPALFTSSTFSGAFGSFNQIMINTGGLALTPGLEYVAYFSGAGFALGGSDSMELGSGSPINVGMAWDNAGGGGPNHPNWNGCQGCAGLDPAYTMTFSDPVPEPATLALLGVGFAGLGVARRRKAI